MRIELDTLGEALVLQGTSLYIGNENDNSKTSVYLEDISRLQELDLYRIIKGLESQLTVNLMLFKEMAIEAYQDEPFIEGSVDGLVVT